MTKNKICPVLKTCEALYRGGFAASEEVTGGHCTIDNIDYIFDEAPIHVGLRAFNNVREEMYSGGSDNDRTENRSEDRTEDRGEAHEEDRTEEDDSIILESFKAADKLHELEVRESIKQLVRAGSADIPTKQELVSRYGIGKTLREKEQSMVSRIKELYPQMNVVKNSTLDH